MLECPFPERPAPLRVGVYVDAFNVYYGARGHCGRGTPGWRWLDLASLAMSMINPYVWPDARLERLVYCSAPRERAGDSSSLADQQNYVNALREHIPELEVVHGKYVPRTKSGVLVAKGTSGASQRRVRSPGAGQWPEWLPGEEVTGPDGTEEVLVSISTFEEKGSDVNVASALLIDVLSGRVDAAMVISNDSDLHLPLRHSREHVPVATINPGTNPTARDLRGSRGEGVGGHWWRRLRPEDFYRHQLPDPVGSFAKPKAW
ncbi:NYN domain-containing protein [Actinopolyspora alba]|nr:NYN domain-containing protein [Actinopolyspora alba]